MTRLFVEQLGYTGSVNNKILQDVLAADADSEDYGKNQEYKVSEEYTEEGLEDTGEAFADYICPVKTNNMKSREEKKTWRKRQVKVQPKQMDLEVSICSS